MNIGKYIKMYSEDLRIKNYSDTTIENYCSQVKCFLEYFSNVATKPSEISERQVNYPPTPKAMGWASGVNTPTNVGSSS